MIGKIKKILVIHTWGIGDLILFTPALKILRENFPDAVIDIFISHRPAVSEVLQENSIVDKILSFEWKKNNLLNKLKLVYKLRKEKYDLALITAGTNPLNAELVSRFEIVEVPDLTKDELRDHINDQYDIDGEFLEVMLRLKEQIVDFNKDLKLDMGYDSREFVKTIDQYTQLRSNNYDHETAIIRS